MSQSATGTHRKRRRTLSSVVAALAAVVIPLTVGSGPATAAVEIDRYAALGDSYAAGIELPNDKDPGDCWRSDHNYATLVAEELGIPALDDITCGGATTVEMTQPQGTNPPQLGVLTADTDLVTLQIGGNDIGFAEILQECLGSGLWPFGSPCKDKYTAGGTDQLLQRIQATAPKIAATVQAIRERAPQARILVLGYPPILPDTGSGCWPMIPIAFGDAPYLRSVHKALNTMIAQQAQANGATYVDIYTPSIGHDACKAAGTRWVEGLSSPFFHPNATGHSAVADIVASAAA
ncbi:SGNH/GDSL hydrolase family protein [Yinghuangia sp. YIM S10712]|uniref:SGNH/GDSL hydrolase family protein n=1 Tax=Yinghuangia sp. YIM S10712 TaxID=3436930 RepID=UPI003F53068C